MRASLDTLRRTLSNKLDCESILTRSISPARRLSLVGTRSLDVGRAVSAGTSATNSPLPTYEDKTTVLNEGSRAPQSSGLHQPSRSEPCGDISQDPSIASSSSSSSSRLQWAQGPNSRPPPAVPTLTDAASSSYLLRQSSLAQIPEPSFPSSTSQESRLGFGSRPVSRTASRAASRAASPGIAHDSHPYSELLASKSNSLSSSSLYRPDAEAAYFPHTDGQEPRLRIRTSREPRLASGADSLPSLISVLRQESSGSPGPSTPPLTPSLGRTASCSVQEMLSGSSSPRLLKHANKKIGWNNLTRSASFSIGMLGHAPSGSGVQSPSSLQSQCASPSSIMDVGVIEVGSPHSQDGKHPSTHVPCSICDEMYPPDELQDHTNMCAFFKSHFDEDTMTCTQRLQSLASWIQEQLVNPEGLGDPVLEEIQPTLEAVMGLLLEGADLQPDGTVEPAEQLRECDLELQQLTGEDHPEWGTEPVLFTLAHYAQKLLRSKFVELLDGLPLEVEVSKLRSDRMSIQDFYDFKCVSRGAYGRVYVARKRTTKEVYAIKAMKKKDIVRKNMVMNIALERDILMHTSHPNLVRCFWSFTSASHIYIVMEYCSGGDCLSLLQTMTRLDEVVAKQFVAELVVALAYLHPLGIVHRDLKPDNMLISSDGRIKLTDFGLSVAGMETPADHHKASDTPSASESATAASGMDPLDKKKFMLPAVAPEEVQRKVGTPDYLAPEVIEGKGCLPQSDWWAVGIILYQMLFGYPPFNDDTPQEIFSNIISKPLTFPPDEVWADEEPPSPAAYDIIRRLLDKDAATRLGANGSDEVESHPFFAGVNWDCLGESVVYIPPKSRDELDTQNFVLKVITPKSMALDVMVPVRREGSRHRTASASREVHAPEGCSTLGRPDQEVGALESSGASSKVGRTSSHTNSNRGGPDPGEAERDADWAALVDSNDPSEEDREDLSSATFADAMNTECLISSDSLDMDAAVNQQYFEDFSSYNLEACMARNQEKVAGAVPVPEQLRELREQFSRRASIASLQGDSTPMPPFRPSGAL